VNAYDAVSEIEPVIVSLLRKMSLLRAREEHQLGRLSAQELRPNHGDSLQNPGRTGDQPRLTVIVQ
jgi:hypothetical protein